MKESDLSLSAQLLDLAISLRVLADKAEQLATDVDTTSLHCPPKKGRCSLAIDRGSLSVRWNGATCFLGYTTAFRLIERLAQRPNQYFSHAQLMDEVWGGPRSKSAIRSAINDLRSRLSNAGMTKLASAIDGSNPGHYGLITQRLQ